MLINLASSYLHKHNDLMKLQAHLVKKLKKATISTYGAINKGKEHYNT
jgi:hypothetical protein